MEIIKWIVLGVFMLVISIEDSRTMWISTWILRLGYTLGFMVRLGYCVLKQQPSYLLEGVLGMVLGYGVLYSLYYIALFLTKKEGVGTGDISFLGMIGLYMGYEMVLPILFLASCLGTLYGIKKKFYDKKVAPFPFTPFISLGVGIVGVYSFLGIHLLYPFIG